MSGRPWRQSHHDDQEYYSSNSPTAPGSVRVVLHPVQSLPVPPVGGILVCSQQAAVLLC